VYRRAREKLWPAAAAGRRSRGRRRKLRRPVFEDLWLGQWVDLRRPVYRRASGRSSGEGHCVDFGVRFFPKTEPKN
jgi:hypothetical protein